MWRIASVVLVGCVERIDPPEAAPGIEKLDDGERLELTWHAVPTTTHPGCEYGVSAYDAARAEVVWFTTPRPYLSTVDASCNETWAYDGSDWREVQPVGPIPRAMPAMAYDPVRERTVLLGGASRDAANTFENPRNEVWEWDGANWVNRTPPVSAVQPEPMTGAGLVFDPVSGSLLLFGGTTRTRSPHQTWSWDGTAWTLLATEGPDRMLSAAYDGDGLLVGHGSAAGTSLAFFWDGSSWTSEAVAGYTGSWVVYDPTADAAVFDGLITPSGLAWLGPDGFVDVEPSGDAVPFSFYAWGTYDAARDRTVVWGGDFGNVVMELEAETAENRAPGFVNPPSGWTFDAGYRSSYALEVNEADGDALSLSVSGVPTTGEDAVELTPYPGAFVMSWTPPLDGVGAYEASFALSDGVDTEALTVPVTVGLRDLVGFPAGVYDLTATGTGQSRVVVCDQQEALLPFEVSCTLHVQNPGVVDIGCGSTVPYWPAAACGSMGGIEVDEDETVVVDTFRMGGEMPSGFRMENGGYLDTLGQWSWPAKVLEGSIVAVADGYEVTATVSLDDWTRNTETVTTEPAVLRFAMPAVAVRTVAELVPGDLVVSEVMRDPRAVADDRGEWFEVHNATGDAVDLVGLEIGDLGVDAYQVDATLIVPADGYLVFGRNADPASNGGVAVDRAVGSDVVLANGADELVLSVGGVVLDRVLWGPGWPQVSGAAMALAAGGTAVTNDQPGSWSAATTVYGAGDKGTPGSANP